VLLLLRVSRTVNSTDQEVRIQPRVKHVLKVSDIVRKKYATPFCHDLPLFVLTLFLSHSANRPISSLIPIRNPKPDVVTISSDSIIESATDSPVRSRLSEKAQGKLRATSPIDATPAPRRVVQRPAGKLTVLPVTPIHDEEEEELPTLDEILAKKAKERLAREFAARKAAAVKEAATKRAATPALVVNDSDDSDLDIQGGPVAARSRAFGGSTPSGFVGAVPATLSKSARTIRDLNGPKLAHQGHQHEDDPSESQIAAAGHTFGKDLGVGQFVPAARRRTKKGAKPVTTEITTEQLNRSLLEKARIYNLETRTKKMQQARRRDAEIVEKARGGEVAKVDLKDILAQKENALKLAKEKGDQVDEEDDAMDEDWEEEERARDSDDVVGSGSERGTIDGDAGDGSGAEASNKEDTADEEEDDDEDSVAVPGPSHRRAKVRVSSDDEDEEATDNAPQVAPQDAVVEFPVDVQKEGGQRVVLPSFLDENPDRGFSQFFGSQFSQEVGVVNDVSALSSLRSLEG
jgi:hypothetical protein